MLGLRYSNFDILKILELALFKTPIPNQSIDRLAACHLYVASQSFAWLQRKLHPQKSVLAANDVQLLTDFRAISTRHGYGHKSSGSLLRFPKRRVYIHKQTKQQTAANYQVCGKYRNTKGSPVFNGVFFVGFNLRQNSKSIKQGKPPAPPTRV